MPKASKINANLNFKLFYTFIFIIILTYLLTLSLLVNKTTSKYIYQRQNEVISEATRQKLLRNTNFLDKIMIITYEGGLMGNELDTLEKVKLGDMNLSVQEVESNIDQLGKCKLGGTEVSGFFYFETKTFFGLPYKTYRLTCKDN